MKHHQLLSVGLTAAALALTSLTASAQIYPTSTANFNQGKKGDGVTAVRNIRSNPDKATGMPQASDVGNTGTETAASINYVSLGFGGSIDLVFSQRFANGAGADLTIYETSYGDPTCSQHPERARVSVSQTGMDGSWILLGDVCMNAPLSLPVGLPWAQYVRIQDVSVAASFGGGHDGYDVDGVTANYLYVPPRPIPPPMCGTVSPPDTFYNYVQGTQKSGALLPANRRMPMRAVGMPQMNDGSGQYNFTSLGFDKLSTPEVEGQITLSFPYTIIDAFGADLFVFETSWGDNPRKSIASYPEMAEFYGSNDGGATWHLLSNVDEAGVPNGQLCRDGKLDISGMPGGTLNWLKIVDKTNRNLFNSAGDGYDVDGVAPAACVAGARVGVFSYDPDAIIDESALNLNVAVKPNPVAAGQNVAISFSIDAQTDLNVEVFDVTGKKLETLKSGTFEAGTHTLNWVAGQGANTGMYFIRVSGDGINSLGTRVMVTK